MLNDIRSFRNNILNISSTMGLLWTYFTIFTRVLFTDNTIIQIEEKKNHKYILCGQKQGPRLLLSQVGIYHQRQVFNARALIDSGSWPTFISERLENKLDFPMVRMNDKVSDLNGATTGTVQGQCSFVLTSQVIQIDWHAAKFNGWYFEISSLFMDFVGWSEI